MKKLLILTALALVPPTAQAAERCPDRGPDELTCSRTVTATRAPQSFVASQGVHFESAWFGADGANWASDSRQANPCVWYGRRGDARVREDVCGGRLVVHYRSIGAPARITFAWERD